MGLFEKPRSEGPDLSGLTQQVQTLTSTMTELKGSLAEVINEVKIIHSNQSNMQENFNTLQQNMNSGNDHQFQEGAAQEQRPRSLAEYTPDELEQLTEAQKYQIMQESIRYEMQDTIKSAINPFGEKLQGLEKNAASFQANTELEKLMKEEDAEGKLIRPDFNDMLQTMVELKRDPARSGLPLSDLYELSRSHYKKTQPEKYAALQEKHFPKPADVQHSYGGFLSNTLQESGEPGDLSLEEAGQEAAREVIEKQGGLPSADGLDALA